MTVELDEGWIMDLHCADRLDLCQAHAQSALMRRRLCGLSPTQARATRLLIDLMKRLGL